jgi:hypothetical protein
MPEIGHIIHSSFDLRNLPFPSFEKEGLKSCGENSPFEKGG